MKILVHNNSKLEQNKSNVKKQCRLSFQAYRPFPHRSLLIKAGQVRAHGLPDAHEKAMVPSMHTRIGMLIRLESIKLVGTLQ
jgi:ABC-type polar amino acid transport system ATPase subunit